MTVTKKILITLLLILATAAGATAQTHQCSRQQGIIRIIDPAFTPSDTISISPIPPQLFNTYLNGMFTTPEQIQNIAPVDNTVEFRTSSAPALYEYINPNGVNAEISILAMPTDTVIITYTPQKYFPEVAGPKTTIDYFRVQEPMYDAYQRLLGVERSATATDADKAAAQAEYQSALRHIFEANTDNAGSVAVLVKMDRQYWNELLPKIQPTAYADPLIAPTYYFIVRCVNWGVEATPSDIHSLCHADKSHPDKNDRLTNAARQPVVIFASRNTEAFVYLN